MGKEKEITRKSQCKIVIVKIYIHFCFNLCMMHFAACLKVNTIIVGRQKSHRLIYGIKATIVFSL